MSPTAEDAHRARLAAAGAEQAEALTAIASHTADGLRAITQALGLDGSHEAQRSIERERTRAADARGLAHDLRLVSHPGHAVRVHVAIDLSRAPAVESWIATPPDPRAVWHALIDLRAWNVRHRAHHRQMLRGIAGDLVPLLRSGDDSLGHAAADRLALVLGD